MEEFLKIHANGQWELCKARQMTPEELKAHKERRDAWLRAKYNKPPATEADKKLPPKESDSKSVRPNMSPAAQRLYNERVANRPKVKHDPKTGKLVVPEGSHSFDVKPEVREGSAPGPTPGAPRTILKRPRRQEE